MKKPVVKTVSIDLNPLKFYPNPHKERIAELERWFIDNYLVIIQVVNYNYGCIDLYNTSESKLVHGVSELVITADGFNSLPSGGNDHPSDYDIVVIENIVKQIVRANEFNRKAVIDRENVTMNPVYEEEM